MSANTVTEASNVAPNDSANPSTAHAKEDPASTNTVVLSVVGGSNASTGAQPAPGKEVKVGSSAAGTPATKTGTPGDGAKQGDPPKKKVATPYNPARALGRARKLLDRSKGDPSPEVVAAQEEIAGRMAALETAADQVIESERAKEDAEHALATSKVAVGDALAPVASLLKERIPGGRSLYAECKDHDHVVTAREVIRRVTLGKVPVGPHLLGPLQRAVGQVGAPERTLADAKKRDRSAKAAYVVARASLMAALPVLTSTLLQQRVATRAKRIVARLAGPATKHGKKGG